MEIIGLINFMRPKKNCLDTTSSQLGRFTIAGESGKGGRYICP